MKRITVSIFCLMALYTQAQNTFPATGNVGIGTTTPNAKLHIPNGGAVIGGDASLNPTLNSTLFVMSKDDKNTTYPFYVGLNSGSDLLWVRGNGNGYFKGSLGIGTTAPQTQLDVVGAISSYYVGVGQQNQTASVRNYVNLGANIHGSVLLSSNLYFNGNDNLKIANTHTTMSGAAMLIPGNGQSNQGSILFYTNQPSSVVADDDFKGNTTMILNSNGNVGIGTTNPTQKLSVNGTIQAKEIVVNTGWSDFVFDNNYKLRPLTEVEQFVKTNKHLPEIPSQKEVEQNGVQLGDISSKLLMKIEELTLYMIEMKKENEQQKAINIKLENQIKKLQNK